MNDDETGGGGNVLTAKLGPLPGWGWLALITVVGIAFWWYTNRKAASSSTAATDQTASSVQSQDVPQFVIQNTFPLPPYAPTAAATQPVNPTTGTVNTGPTAGGPNSATNTGQAPAVPAPITNPTKTSPAPKPTAAGKTVTVTKWTAKNPAWSSTISGIAAHYGIRAWQTVWNDPHNAALRAKRKTPSLIQPGDKVYVPA